MAQSRIAPQRAGTVRAERTEWRDLDLSKRHRAWGFNCPAVDLDFLMVEYNLGKAVVIVEYKHFRASMPNVQHPTYRALADLADNYSGINGGLPFIVVFYWPDSWAMRVYPINGKAKLLLHQVACRDMSEREYVTMLYQIRALAIEQSVLRTLHTEMPPED